MELEDISALRGINDKPTRHVLTGRYARHTLQDTGVVLDEGAETVTTDMDHIGLLVDLREMGRSE